MGGRMKMLCIKVDVDTFAGMREGVPRLIDIFRACGVKATFFISMGPDNSGRAVRRVFTKKGFLRKMLRTRAVSVYGFPTVLYGTLLPAPQIVAENQPVIDGLKAGGFEIGIHGYDHVKWHDYVPSMSESQVAGELTKAVDIYRKAVGSDPRSFAAPGWSWSAAAQRLMDKNGIIYTSNTRGTAPFFPVYGNERSGVLELPTTLPTLDEVLGVKISDLNALGVMYHELVLKQDLAVFTIHAELEGMVYADWFAGVLNRVIREGVRVCDLATCAQGLLKDTGRIPFCPIEMGEIDGRAGAVALQGKARQGLSG